MNEKEKENVNEEEEEEEEEGERRSSPIGPIQFRQATEGSGSSSGQRSDICDFSFFFPLLACRSRVGAIRSRVKAVSEKRKKKKKETLAGHRNPASRTRTGVRHVSDTHTTPKMACPCNLGCTTYFTHFQSSQIPTKCKVTEVNNYCKQLQSKTKN